MSLHKETSHDISTGTVRIQENSQLIDRRHDLVGEHMALYSLYAPQVSMVVLFHSDSLCVAVPNKTFCEHHAGLQSFTI